MSDAPAEPIRGDGGPFLSDGTRSWTLPSRYYVDRDIHDREQARIFQRSWCYVGHAGELPAAGSYLTDEVAGQPVMLVRGRDGRIRAFFNVCRHRGHLLLKGSGSLKSGITCPYHAWSYALDGRLRAARLTETVPGFDKADFPLRALALSNVAGLLFVNLDAEAEPMAKTTAGFEETLLDHLPALPDFAPAWRLEYDIAANWKVCIDNFSEGYHIPVAHPELKRLHGGPSAAATIGENFACFRNGGRGSYEDFPVREGEPYLSWTLWPNHCLLSLPGSRHLIVLRLAADGPGHCRERVDILAPPGEVSASLERTKRLFADEFNREDIALVESVQRGLSSIAYDQGRYVIDPADSWFSESGLHRFHSKILAALG